jgi:flagellar basal-body rod modification protein FlgD
MAIVDTIPTQRSRTQHQGQDCDRQHQHRRRDQCGTGNQSLGKDAFLQLLVTQLKNQNPLIPQDNGAFVAQLAQFSSLEGITTLNDSVSASPATTAPRKRCRLLRW